MTEKKRNVLVGVTILIAAIILGGMIIKFRELPGFMRPGYEVRFTYGDTGSVREGSDVLLDGIRIGRISEIRFTEDDPRKGVTIVATIDSDIRIPGDVNAYFRSGGFGGGGAIELASDGKSPGSERKDPVTEGPLAWLPRDNGFTMKVAWRPGGGDGLIPEDLATEIREAMGSFKSLADTLNTFFASPPKPTTTPTTTSGPALAGPEGPANFQATMAKLDAALDAINSILGDKENQANFKAALTNFRIAAAAMTEAMNKLKATAGEVSGATKSASAKFDELMTHLIEDADRMGQVLTSLHRVAVKIDTGKGTAGRLINDPAMYENLLDAAKQLKATLDDFQQLLDKWKREGVRIR